jgi:hypothetical protein
MVQCNGCAVHHTASGVCSVWWVSVRCVQSIRRVQSMLCTVYGGAVDVVCGVCSGYDGCRVTGVQGTIWRVVYAVYGVCSVGCVQCMVCAV